MHDRSAVTDPGNGNRAAGVAVVAMVVNVLGDLTLGVRYGIAGLALSTSLSLVLGTLLAVALLARRHRAPDVGRPAAAQRRRVSGNSRSTKR